MGILDDRIIHHLFNNQRLGLKFQQYDVDRHAGEFSGRQQFLHHGTIDRFITVLDDLPVRFIGHDFGKQPVNKFRACSGGRRAGSFRVSCCTDVDEHPCGNKHFPTSRDRSRCKHGARCRTCSRRRTTCRDRAGAGHRSSSNHACFRNDARQWDQAQGKGR
jgi:hypothetical protein